MTYAFPLTKANRIKLASAFRSVPRVDLSIDCAIEGQMGKVFVDDLDHPRVFKIETGPFFYFSGKPDSAASREMLAGITPYTLFMPSAPGWVEAARSIHAENLLEIDRYSFSSQNLSPIHLGRLERSSPYRESIQPMTAQFARRYADLFWGTDHFIELFMYDSPDDFNRRSAGFYLADGGELIAAAYGSLACSLGLEVSIYVAESYRCQGIATALASRLLLWCLERGLEPHWDAANPESCKLALKLGYTPLGSYNAYYLRVGP
jgi:GNAT superfamily N-acetyltransferase